MNDDNHMPPNELEKLPPKWLAFILIAGAALWIAVLLVWWLA